MFKISTDILKFTIHIRYNIKNEFLVNLPTSGDDYVLNFKISIKALHENLVLLYIYMILGMIIFISKIKRIRFQTLCMHTKMDPDPGPRYVFWGVVFEILTAEYAYTYFVNMQCIQSH